MDAGRRQERHDGFRQGFGRAHGTRPPRTDAASPTVIPAREMFVDLHENGVCNIRSAILSSAPTRGL
jgi:hypothetical protein